MPRLSKAMPLAPGTPVAKVCATPGLAAFRSAALIRTTSLKGPAARYKSPLPSKAIPPGEESTFLPSTVRASILPTTTDWGDLGSTRKTLPVTRSDVYKMPSRSAVMFSMMTVRSTLAGSRSTSMDTVGLPGCMPAQPPRVKAVAKANRPVDKSLIFFASVKLQLLKVCGFFENEVSPAGVIRPVPMFASNGQTRPARPLHHRPLQ